MKDNVKNILKTKTSYYNFAYDEDSYAPCGLFEDGAAIMQRMDDDELLEKLVSYGMNNGFTSQVQKLIKEAVNIRKKLWDNEKLTRGSRKANAVWSDYEALVKSASAMMAVKKSSLMTTLDTHIVEAKRKATAFASSSSPYAYDELVTTANDALKAINKIATIVSTVLDTTSKSAYDSAVKIAESLNKWSNITFLNAVENGKIGNEAVVLAPLGEALRIASKWADAELGVTDKNPAERETSRLKAYDGAKDQLSALI